MIHPKYSLNSPQPKTDWVPNYKTNLWEPPSKQPDSGLWTLSSGNWIEIEYSEDNKYIACSYPRSGNTYLNYYLALAYGINNGQFKENWHTVNKITSSIDKIMVPLRNPLDCISSWANHQTGIYGLGIEKVTPETINDDINYYLRFMNSVLHNIDKVVIFNYDKMILSLSYIDDLVFSNFGFLKINNVSDNDIKMAMENGGNEKNLPQNNQQIMGEIKEMVQKSPKYKKCLSLHEQILAYT
jgi:hypothetical protein